MTSSMPMHNSQSQQREKYAISRLSFLNTGLVDFARTKGDVVVSRSSGASACFESVSVMPVSI